jgi:hypothetical protein
LPLIGEAGFLLFDGAAGALLYEGLVVSTGPPFSVGREASCLHQNIKVWSLGFTCTCGSGLLVLSSKLKVPVGQQSQQAQMFLCLHGIKGPGVYLSLGMGFQEPQQLLQSWEKKVCRQWEFWGLLAGHRLPEAQYNSATGTREPRLLPCTICYLWSCRILAF